MMKAKWNVWLLSAALLTGMMAGCQTNTKETAAETAPAASEAGTESQTEALTEAQTEAGSAAAESEAQTTAGETRVFVDSAGREVALPDEIGTVAPSGQVAQMVLYTAVPDKLAGIAVEFSGDAKAYIDEAYTALPVFGQFYGKNANLNMEALVQANPDIVVDIGEKKENIDADMDQLQEQIGIPVVFIEADMETMDETYRKLGELFGNEDEMAVLSDYCNEVITHAKESTEALSDEDKVSVYIAREEEGLGTDARGSFHAETLELIGAVNIADVEAAGPGGGSIVSMEQILTWNPDVILVYNQEVYDIIMSSDVWADLDAVKAEKVYMIPSGPYNFISNPPSVNRMIGVDWLGNLLYPDRYDFDEEKLKEFYQNFYHLELNEEQIQSLIG